LCGGDHKIVERRLLITDLRDKGLAFKRAMAVKSWGLHAVIS